MDKIIFRMADKWCIKRQFLKDIYFLMCNDLRFSSARSLNGVRYVKVSHHLKDNYAIDISPDQLKYLVYLIKRRK